MIILDLGLPFASGEQFLKARQIDTDLAQIPVIVITGKDRPVEELQPLGVVAIFRKPFDPPSLVSKIRAYLPH